MSTPLLALNESPAKQGPATGSSSAPATVTGTRHLTATAAAGGTPPAAPSSAACSAAAMPIQAAAPATASVAAPTSKRTSVRRAAASSFISQRRGIYQFVRRWPSDLRAAGLVRQTFMRCSLRTGQLRHAQVLARQMAVEFDKQVATLRDTLSGQGTDAAGLPSRGALDARDFGSLASSSPELQFNEVRVCDIPALVSRFEADVLHSDDRNREEAMSGEEAGEYLADIEGEIAQLRQLHAQGLHGQYDDVVQGYLHAEDLLPPQDPQILAQLQRKLLQAHLRVLRALRARLDGEVHETPATPPPALRSRTDVDDLLVALKHWENHTKPRPKTLHEARTMVHRLMSETGKSRMSTLTTDDLVFFRESESTREGRAGKRVAPQTFNKGLALLRAIAKLVHDDFLKHRGIDNPFESVRKAVVKDSHKQVRMGLSSEELNTIFNGPVHRLGERTIGGAGEACYWMPLLAHSCGARLSELAQLRVGNILERNGVPCMLISCSREEGAEKVDVASLSGDAQTRLLAQSVKTAQSHRLIPIHPRLLELGFLDYVRWVREQGHVQLFPAVIPDCHDVAGGNFSKFWTRYLCKLGVKRRGLDFNSFRHWFKTACRSAEVSSDFCDYIQGHEAGRVSQSYGDFETKDLLDAIKRIALPALESLPRWTVPGTARMSRETGTARGDTC